MKKALAILAIPASVLCAPTIAGAQLHDADIVPFVEGVDPDRQIKTGRVVTSEQGETVVEDRVFAADLIDFFGFAFAEDPGFNSAVSTFAPFSVMEINILDALRVWENDNFDTLATYVPTGETHPVPLVLEFSFGATVVQSPTTADTFVEGLDFAVSSLGDTHVHPEHLLPGETPNGVYLLKYQIENPTDGAATSAPFFMLYDWNADPADLLAAEQWVRDNVLGPAADLTGDGAVDGADLAVLLASWGACPAPCAADLTGDGVVDGADLATLLAQWG